MFHGINARHDKWKTKKKMFQIDNQVCIFGTLPWIFYWMPSNHRYSKRFSWGCLCFWHHTSQLCLVLCKYHWSGTPSSQLLIFQPLCAHCALSPPLPWQVVSSHRSLSAERGGGRGDLLSTPPDPLPWGIVHRIRLERDPLNQEANQVLENIVQGRALCCVQGSSWRKTSQGRSLLQTSSFRQKYWGCIITYEVKQKWAVKKVNVVWIRKRSSTHCQPILPKSQRNVEGNSPLLLI